MNQKGRRLYLFSSDQSHLYVQDILNVLGAPRGQPYTFRYEAKYLDPTVRAEWARLQDTEVLVVFSLQQRARYQQPAFIPVRAGWVLQTHREGDSYFVKFRIGGYVSLPKVPFQDGQERPDTAVQTLTQKLSELTSVPYAASASLGRSLPAGVVDTSAEPSVLFQRICLYLSHTTPFENANFVRVLGIKAAGSREAEYLENYDAAPARKFKAGKAYDLGLFYAQPTAPSQPRRFVVSADETAVHIIGRGSFAVDSRYNEITVRLAAGHPGGLKDLDTVIVIEPCEGVQGPNLELDVCVEADRGRTISTAILQMAALVGVALAGVLSTAPLALRLVLAIMSAMAAVGLGLYGAPTLRAPMLPSPAPSGLRPTKT